MNNSDHTTQASGEDVAANVPDSGSAGLDAAESQTHGPVDELRLAAALNELQQLRDDLAARDECVKQLQEAIAHLEAPPSSSAVKPHDSGAAARPSRGAMSPRLGPEAANSRQRNLDDAAIHASATGSRRDLLSYLRLRRKK